MKPNKLYTGDCVEVMETLPADTIDLTVTSPPYDNLRTYGGYNFDFDAICKQLFRVTKQGGVCVWIVNDAVIDGSESGSSFRQALGFLDNGWLLHDTMIWNKESFTFPCPNRYHGVFEYMFVFSKDKPKTFNPISDRLNKSFGKNYRYGKWSERLPDGTMKIRNMPNKEFSEFGKRFNIWNLPNASQERVCLIREHPAQMAYGVARDHISTWSNEGDLVLDPMCGSGTTCVAARDLKRNYIGIDCNKEYVKISKKRLKAIKDPK